jgi:outer membrane protein assembly factor BamD
MNNPVSGAGGRSRGRAALRGAFIALLGLSIAACSLFNRGNDDEFAVIEEEPADRLYNEGLALVGQGSYRAAAEKFEEIDRVHPYSDWARRSLIMSAYAHFESARYSEAIRAAQRYITLHPGSSDAAYAQYLIAESHYRQIPQVSRDQEQSERAAIAFRELIEKYPDSEYAVAARDKLDVSRDQVAGKEMEVGRYYLGQRRYLAAINRFRNVVTDHQETRHVEEALHRLTEAYYALGLVSEAQTAAAVLGHNFPDSEWYQDSHTLLQRGGYSPQESEGSWISRLFRGRAA